MESVPVGHFCVAIIRVKALGQACRAPVDEERVLILSVGPGWAGEGVHRDEDDQGGLGFGAVSEPSHVVAVHVIRLI